MSNTTETSTFSLSAWEDRRNETFYAESDAWHHIIGWLSSSIAKGESLDAAALEVALLEAEKFGNERLVRKGYPLLASVERCIDRLNAL